MPEQPLGQSSGLRIYLVQYDPIPEVIVAAENPDQARELADASAREYGWGIDRPASGVSLYELSTDKPAVLAVNTR